jgi:lysophospholipase L1-like esterase
VSPRSLLAAVAALVTLAACTGDGGAAPATGPAATQPAATSATTTSTAPTTTPTSATPATTPAVSAECDLAARVVSTDVALALDPSDGAASDEPATGSDTASGEPVLTYADEMVDALRGLATSSSRMARPAQALLAGGLDSVGSGGRRRSTEVESLNVAMIGECRMRLSGLGVLRPDRDPDDALAGLGIATLGDDTCATADALRWADVQWRAATNGFVQDRYGVVVRHALGALRLGDGDDVDAELDLPSDIERANLGGWSLSGDHKIGVIRLDADLRRACGEGLEQNGLLMEGLGSPTAGDLADHPAPDWGEAVTVDADTAHGRWCAIVDDIYARDAALTVALDEELESAERVGLDLRLLFGALRAATVSGGSIATLQDVRVALDTTKVIELADLSAIGRLDEAERRALGDLDEVMIANCGVGLSSTMGVLGRFAWSSSFPKLDPTEPAPSATTTTSTSLPTYLPSTAVAIVGDSLTYSAQTEIVESLATLGLGDVVVDGQVSRRMTSSTDTIRSGETVVLQIAAEAAPRVWVIALGTNDVASGSSADSIRASVQRVLDAIPDDSLVVWVDTYIRDEHDAVVAGNQIIRDVVSQRPGAVIADFYSYGDDPGIVVSDGVHLTDAGRVLFAHVIANGIADVLGRNPLFDLTPAPTTTSTPVLGTPPTRAPTTTTRPATISTSSTTTTTTTTTPSTTTTGSSTTTTTDVAAPAVSTTSP